MPGESDLEGLVASDEGETCQGLLAQRPLPSPPTPTHILFLKANDKIPARFQKLTI